MRATCPTNQNMSKVYVVIRTYTDSKDSVLSSYL